jgi:hypothetical protein
VMIAKTARTAVAMAVSWIAKMSDMAERPRDSPSVRPPPCGLRRRAGEGDPSERGAVAVVPYVVVHRVVVRSAGLVLVRVDVRVAWFAGRDLDLVRGWSAACAVFAGQVEDAMAAG